jgi:outer membrane receptor protein involved in Fe transport
MSKIIQRTYESCRGKSPWAATGLFICALNGLCLAANEASTTDEQSSTLEPVVVTARRQNENLEKVPVAISALSQQDLTERKITTEADLESAVPGTTTTAFYDLQSVQVVKGPQGILIWGPLM